ncbi:phosphocholine cytidylyltransferase family protein [Deltaproteobacteria bacterium TL4]
MKIYLDLTEEQNQFLEDQPDFDLQGWFQRALRGKINELKIKNENINVIIAAAGYDTRISEVVHEVPKAMLMIKGKSLLERQLDELKKFNIKNITIVRGYKKERIIVPEVHYIDNNDYEKTGILYSFFLASEKMTGKTILLYSDILFGKDILEKLIYDASDFAVIVDKSWRDHYHNRIQHTVSEAELVTVEEGWISHMGCDIPYQEAYGEFIGLSAFSSKGAEVAKNLYAELNQTVDKNSLFRKPLTTLFNGLIAKGEKITPIDILGGWFEIDTFEDYRKSWTMVP